DGWKAAVLQGSVKIVSLSPTGKEVVLNVIHAGRGLRRNRCHRRRRAQRRCSSDDGLRAADHRPPRRAPDVRKASRNLDDADADPGSAAAADERAVEDVLFRNLEARLAKALLQLMEDAKRRGSA